VDADTGFEPTQPELRLTSIGRGADLGVSISSLSSSSHAGRGREISKYKEGTSSTSSASASTSSPKRSEKMGTAGAGVERPSAARERRAKLTMGTRRLDRPLQPHAADLGVREPGPGSLGEAISAARAKVDDLA